MQKRNRPNRQPRGGGNTSTSTSHNNTRPPPHNTTPRTPRSQPSNSRVPPHRSINPGTAVSIVLKADQGTGRQVTGIVSELLTRGDHPRGVKVRLRDGRVGRVQGVVSAAEGEEGERRVGGEGAGLGRNGERGGVRMVGGRVERDIREEDEYLFDENRGAAGVRGNATEGLFGALEEADRAHEASRGLVGQHVQGGTQMALCPVCGDFEGDEMAVAHHVEEHFS